MWAEIKWGGCIPRQIVVGISLGNHGTLHEIFWGKKETYVEVCKLLANTHRHTQWPPAMAACGDIVLVFVCIVHVFPKFSDIFPICSYDFIGKLQIVRPMMQPLRDQVPCSPRQEDFVRPSKQPTASHNC